MEAPVHPKRAQTPPIRSTTYLVPDIRKLANGKARAGRTIAGPVKAAPFESPSADVRGYPRLFTFR